MCTPIATQAGRPLQVSTPLGTDVFLLTGFTGWEGISQLYQFLLNLLACSDQDIGFDKVLGQPVSVRLAHGAGPVRYFNGIASRVGQGAVGREFTSYWLDLVPKLWLLTNRAQCRIFQRVSVPDILRTVLDGLDVEYQIQGTFHPREYCVQYRETDFNFVSRLMEEEGIYYFFKHTESSHTLVLANTPQSHQAIAGPGTVSFVGSEEVAVEDGRSIFTWSKTQQLRPGRYALGDQHFELPRRRLGAETGIVPDVEAGTDRHPFRLPANGALEIYDYPGDYARRFDGVSRGGGDQSAELQRIFDDNQRTAELRMQQEGVAGLTIGGLGDCPNLVPGYRFMLTGHANANGAYVVTGVGHSARNTAYRSDGDEFAYQCQFSCIPLSLPFRPPPVTARPAIQGTQTAVVVGPAGQEIFTDRYGRVKVQFPWDRNGRYDADSSCWVRVAQFWAGKRWGASFWPRIGQEVVVAFEDGNPDRPVIVGSVYNAEQMPPYLGDAPDRAHRNDPKVSGIKTCSTPGGDGFNELRFDDTKGNEQVFLHAERDMDVRVRNDSRQSVGGGRHVRIGGASQETVGGNYALDAGDEIHIKAGTKVVIEAGSELSLIGPGGFLHIGPGGVTVDGIMVWINSGGPGPACGCGAGPAAADQSVSGYASASE
jgi:type VI secretion system secreted protein VgrG